MLQSERRLKLSCSCLGLLGFSGLGLAFTLRFFAEILNMQSRAEEAQRSQQALIARPEGSTAERLLVGDGACLGQRLSQMQLSALARGATILSRNPDGGMTVLDVGSEQKRTFAAREITPVECSR